jgi:excisionase family DNA binding protein
VGDAVIQMKRRRPSGRQESVLLLAGEVAKWLKVDESTIRRWTREHRIPCVRLGDGRGAPVRYPEAEVEEWWRKRMEAGRV